MKTSASGIAAGLLVMLVAGVCVRLGFWQLARLGERRAANEVVAAALAAPPLDLGGAGLDSVLADPGRYRFRRARASGVYLSDEAFLLRGRARQGAPGVHLVAPLRLAGDARAILVDRGWLPSPDAATADPRPYASGSLISVEGLLHPLEDAAGDPSPVLLRSDQVEVRSFQRLDARTLRAAIATELLPFYLQRNPTPGATDRLPLADPLPTLDEGPHLGYAFQWFSFAAIAVIGFGVVLARGRHRR